MQVCDVKKMLKNSYEDPCFFANFHNLGRGLIGGDDQSKTYIKVTKYINYWRIVGDNLEEVQAEGILFDAETYLLQWAFEYITENNTIHEDTLFYYWKGNSASKGYSPLPPHIENQNPVVERICQWSEPALFFHIFPKNLIVFRNSQENFDPTAKRLLMVRGELPSEIHLYEVPCFNENLRSKGTFILINPGESTIYYWYGSAVPNKYENFENILKIQHRVKHWTNYKVMEFQDGRDDAPFFDSLLDKTGEYTRLPKIVTFTPRLFYFNSITGDFLATEVECPLRSKQYYVAFPFLQSHLYTADQPALFLLDNDVEIWLWEGWKTPGSNLELFEIELKLAKETAKNYAKEKGHNNEPVPIKYISAGLEPLDFINLFPYWNKIN